MKNIKILVAFLMVFMGLTACEEEMEKAMIKQEIAANSLNEMSSADYMLTFESRSEVFEEFAWTAPDFGFEASVTYTLQMDTAGGSFAKPFSFPTTQALTVSPTVNAVNAALLGMGLDPDVAAEVQFRVMSSVNPNVAPVYTNVVSANVTPYLATFPPIYIIGDAQGWNLGNALEVTSTGPGTYEAVGLFQADGKFRFFAMPSWDAEQWGWSFFEGGTVASELASGEDWDSNFLFGGTTGVYKISVNLNAKTITLEEGELPTLFVIGDAQGWNLQAALELTFLGGGKFEGTGTFQDGGYFRFFEKADWAATQYGYSYFDGGTIPAEFTDGGDGDSNFIFAGSTGEYTVSVDLNSKEISLEVATQYPAALYLVGDDQGWSFANSPTFTNLGGGVYEAEGVNFTKESTFRFFEEADNWSDDFGAGFFTGGIDDELAAVGDNDDNFSFVGESGLYTITVSLSDMSIVVEPYSAYPSSLYLVGDDQSWTFANSPVFSSSTPGVFEATGVTFTNGSTFRFFEELDNWSDDFRYAYFTEVSSDLEAAGDNDDNFKFIGTDGAFNITVDLTTKSVQLSQ